MGRGHVPISYLRVALRTVQEMQTAVWKSALRSVAEPGTILLEHGPFVEGLGDGAPFFQGFYFGKNVGREVR